MLFRSKSLPTTEEDIPRRVKIKENPSIKTREFVIVRNLTLALFILPVRSSKDMPVMNET